MPAEGANGSRLSGFACGRDDVREGGAALHLLFGHPGRSSRDPGPIGCQSGGEGTPTRATLSLSSRFRRSRRPGPSNPRSCGPSLSCAYLLASGTHLSFVLPDAQPFLSSSRARRSRDPGPASRGPVEGTPEQHGSGSPIPARRCAPSGKTRGGAGAKATTAHLLAPGARRNSLHLRLVIASRLARMAGRGREARGLHWGRNPRSAKG